MHVFVKTQLLTFFKKKTTECQIFPLLEFKDIALTTLLRRMCDCEEQRGDTER